jgi:hypothetical protein
MGTKAFGSPTGRRPALIRNRNLLQITREDSQMKKFLVTMLLVATTATAAHAGLRVVGKGDNMHLDPSAFPSAMKANYEIVRVRCVKCHTLERTIVAIQTGVAPISGQPFDRSATKAYGVKMLRKPDSNMTKPEVKASVDFLNFLLVETER